MSNVSRMGLLPLYTSYCWCGSCGEYFKNPTSFDMHRKSNPALRGKPGARYCVPPGEIVGKKGKKKGEPLLKMNPNGYWQMAGTWRGPK